MTKEEKKAKGKEEEEVPEGFIDAVNEFYETSDIIFKCFDDIILSNSKINAFISSRFPPSSGILFKLKPFVVIKSAARRICETGLRNTFD